MVIVVLPEATSSFLLNVEMQTVFGSAFGLNNLRQEMLAEFTRQIDAGSRVCSVGRVEPEVIISSPLVLQYMPSCPRTSSFG